MLAAFFIGLVGSMHCLAMCSPLAIAVNKVSGGFFSRRLAYNAGRVATYMIMGALMSAFGELLQIGRLQSITAFIFGIGLLVFGISGITGRPIVPLASAVLRFQNSLKRMFGSMLQHKSLYAVTALGLINGLLPCGLTMLALSYCVTLPSMLDGTAFMLAFGMGTFPVMLGFAGIAAPLIQKLGLRSKYISRLVMISLGCLLLARIYFVHPDIPGSTTDRAGEITLCR